MGDFLLFENFSSSSHSSFSAKDFSFNHQYLHRCDRQVEQDEEEAAIPTLKFKCRFHDEEIDDGDDDECEANTDCAQPITTPSDKSNLLSGTLKSL